MLCFDKSYLFATITVRVWIPPSKVYSSMCFPVSSAAQWAKERLLSLLHVVWAFWIIKILKCLLCFIYGINLTTPSLPLYVNLLFPSKTLFNLLKQITCIIYCSNFNKLKKIVRISCTVNWSHYNKYFCLTLLQLLGWNVHECLELLIFIRPSVHPSVR